MQRAGRWRTWTARLTHSSANLWSRSNSSTPRIFRYEPDTTAKAGTHQERWRDNQERNIYEAGRKTAVESPLHAGRNDPQLIDTQSLAGTLKAHQRANRDVPIIRPLRIDDSSNLKPRKFRVQKSNRSSEFSKLKASGASRNTVPSETDDAVLAKHLNLKRDDGWEVGADRTDYEGCVQELAFDWEIVGNVSRYLRLPWMKELDQDTCTRASSHERLAREIHAADVFFTPTRKEHEAARFVQKDIEEFVMKHDLKLDVIGSRASGLASPLSDLDLNLVIKNASDNVPETADMGQMGRLYKSMKFPENENPPFQTSYFAALARIPIIVGFHTSTGLEFQIQSTNSGYGSLEVTKGLTAEFPMLKPLFKILKQALRIRGLDGKSGGLTSYPLLTMIAISLKLNPVDASSGDLSQILLKFLDFWSKIDFYNTGITHLPSRYLNSNLSLDGALPSLFKDKKTRSEIINAVTQDPVGARPVLFEVKKRLGDVHPHKDDFMMTIHDPANPYNDLGRSAYLIKHIQATFMDIRSKLKTDMSEWDRTIRANGQASERPPSLLRSLIEGDYSMYNLERKRLTSATND